MSKLERLTVGLEQVLPLHLIGEDEPGTRVYEDLDERLTLKNARFTRVLLVLPSFLHVTGHLGCSLSMFWVR